MPWRLLARQSYYSLYSAINTLASHFTSYGDLVAQFSSGCPFLACEDTALGGSWVVISGVVNPLIWVITIVTLLVTPLITTHEPPSSGRLPL